jgi:hypothetical protein
LTISKAIKSYKNWLDQISRRSRGELTVVLPDLVPLEPIIKLWETQPNVTKGPMEFPNVTSDDSTTTPAPTVLLSNSSPSSDTTDDSEDVDLPPIAMNPFTQSNESNRPLLPQMDADKADPVHLTIISDVVTESPQLPITTTNTLQSIETTAQPLLSESPVPEGILAVSNHNSPLSFPMIRRRPLPTTPKPITRAPISRRPPTSVFPASRKRPAVPVSNDNPSDIPWLILKSPDDSSLSEMYRTPSSTTTTARPFIPNHQEMVRPVKRRPLVRLPSTTVRPASSSSRNPWIILKSPQTNKNQKRKRPAPIRPKVPVVDHQGIPWLILASPPDPAHPSSESSSEMNHYYPDVPSNQLYKRKDSFPGYFVPTI